MRSRGGRPWPASAWVTIVGLVTVLVVVVQLRSTDDGAAPAADATTTTAVARATTSVARATTTTSGSTGTTTTVVATTSTATGPVVPPTIDTDATRAAVDRLRVVEVDPDMAPYQRSMFGDGWDYDPTTGCNTRERVLVEESLEPPAMGDRCQSLSGRWVSLYDGVTVTSPTELQIDHFVPLADAWRSGAATWTGEQRVAFANDLTDPDTLVAVTGATNMSKSDSSPDEWLPPDRAAWCTYVDRWVSVKARWNLSVQAAEKAGIERVLADC